MRKKVFFALGCVLYLTGCDSSSLEKAKSFGFDGVELGLPSHLDVRQI